MMETMNHLSPKQEQKEVKNESPPFFIVGSPRSGTKLLRSILSSHSKVAMPGETFYFSQVVRRAKPYLKGFDIIDIDGFLQLVKTSKSMEQFSSVIARCTFNKTRPWSIGGFFSEICSSYANTLGKVRWGEKTPSHLWFWKTINTAYPDCKFIVTVRDGRDVICSLPERPWSTGSPFADAFRWKMEINKGCKLIAELGSRRAMQISYEELVTEPVKTVTKVCGHLGLTYESSMHKEFEDTEDMIRRRAEGRLEEGSERIYTSSIRRYKRDLDAKTISYLTCLLHPELRNIGMVEAREKPPSTGIKLAVYVYSALMFSSTYGRRLILHKVS
jgi:hypothetical protein